MPKILTATPLIPFVFAAIVCAALASGLERLPGFVGPLAFLMGAAGLVLWARGCLHSTRMLSAAILGSSLIFLIVAIGNGRSPRSIERLDLESSAKTSVVLDADIDAVVSRSPFGWRLSSDVIAIDGRPLAEPASVLLYVPGEFAERAALLPGARVEVFADVEPFAESDFPRGFDERAFYSGRGYLARASASEPPVVRGRAFHWRSGLTRWRLTLEDRVLDAVGPERAGPVLALTTGTRGFLPPTYRTPFEQTGTAHLLAISGLHLGALAALLWFGLGWTVVRVWPDGCERFGRRRICGILVVACLGAYVAAIGAPVSAVRALCAISLAVGAALAMRAFCPLHTLAAAAVAAVLWQPSVVHELGFQLSFSATGGILLFLEWRPAWLEHRAAPWEEHPTGGRWLQRLGIFVGVSVSASLATWPVLLAHFGVVSGSGLWVNLVATPLFGTVVFPLVVLLTLGAVIVPAAAPKLLGIAYQLLDTTRAGLAMAADTPGSEIIVGVPSPGAVVVAALAVLGLVTSRARAARVGLCSIVLAAVLLMAGPDRPDDSVRVHFIPVGQGDATLLQFPNGDDMLIDAGGRRMGPDPGRRLVVPYLRRLGVERLEWLVVTHSDWDHLGGAAAVVDAYEPDTLVVDALDDSGALAALVHRADTSSIRRVERTISPASLPGIEIVRPDPVGRASRNDRSLVVLLRRARASALFAADIELVGENWLRTNRRTRATLLKIPHHGSRTSSSRRFLDDVQPIVAVSSSGRNHHFGHPHPEVVSRYERRGVAVFGTHANGLVVVDLAFDGGIVVRARR